MCFVLKVPVFTNTRLRLFAKAGLIHSELRNSLLPHNLRMCFLNKNLIQVDFNNVT